MTINNLINAIPSVEARAIARYQAMTSSDIAALDIAPADLDGNDRDDGPYCRIWSRGAPQTVADSFAPLLNC